jgi:hypothetical protein
MLSFVWSHVHEVRWFAVCATFLLSAAPCSAQLKMNYTYGVNDSGGSQVGTISFQGDGNSGTCTASLNGGAPVDGTWDSNSNVSYNFKIGDHYGQILWVDGVWYWYDILTGQYGTLTG